MKKLIIPAIALMMAFAINATEIIPLGQPDNNETTLIAKRAKKRAKKIRKGKMRGQVIGKSVSQLRAMGYSVRHISTIEGGYEIYSINGARYIADFNGIIFQRSM